MRKEDSMETLLIGFEIAIALIVGDDSALTDADQEAILALHDRFPGAFFAFPCGPAERTFARCEASGLMSDCIRVAVCRDLA